jgi:CheY-like chemotaxis protein
MEKSVTCFLIDDDEDDREIFAIAMEQAYNDYQCVVAINGNEALQKLRAEPSFIPDFIFLDLNMPMMGGKECLVEIKKIPRLNKVPVIIYSTSSHQKDIEDTKQLGAAHFLIKPSSISGLTRSLSGLLKNQKFSFCLNEEAGM